MESQTEQLFHTTCNGNIIPLENIDFIGDIDRPYSFVYNIHMKSGNKAQVVSNDYPKISDCRKKLVAAFQLFVTNKYNN